MLSALDGNPETYQLFVREYFELEVKLGAISRVFEHEPLSVELLQAFPCSRNFQDVIADAEEIGYPIKP